MAFSWNGGIGNSITLVINRSRCIPDDWPTYETDIQMIDCPIVIIPASGTARSSLIDPGGLARLHIFVCLNLENSRGAAV